jgi:calcium-dependent protein kinase
MEFCPGKLLFQKFDEKKRTNEKEAASIMMQVLEALHYLHQHQIVHMDLKSENIIYNGRTVKLIDFGLAQNFRKNRKMKKIRGTKYYLAPEVITKNYNHKCDIWSAGILLFMLLTGKVPFKGDSEVELFDNILKNRYSSKLEDFPKISKSAKELINLMLTPDFKTRPESEELMKHAWLSSSISYDDDKTVALLDNIKKFNFHNKLQRGIFYYFINNLITNEEHENLSKAFKLLDKDKDGELSREEFIKGLKKLGKKLSEKEIKTKFELIDTDNSGSISYMEFVAAAFTKEEFLSGQRLHKLFKIIDLDNNNQISVDEFMVLFNKSEYITKKELEEIIKDTDVNQDGEIDFKEFKYFMRQVMTDFEFSSKQMNYEKVENMNKSRAHSMFTPSKIKKRQSGNVEKDIKNLNKKNINSRRSSKKNINVSKLKKYKTQNLDSKRNIDKKRTGSRRHSVRHFK